MHGLHHLLHLFRVLHHVLLRDFAEARLLQLVEHVPHHARAGDAQVLNRGGQILLVDSQHRIDRREFLGRQTHLQRDGGEIHRGILRHQTSQHSAVGTSATAGVAGALHGDAPLLAHKRDDAVEETVVDLGDLLVHAFVALGELLDLLLLGHATLHRFRLGQELFDLILAQKAEALSVAVVQTLDGDALFLGRVDIEVHQLRELGRGHGVGHLPRSSLRARGLGEAKGCRKN